MAFEDGTLSNDGVLELFSHLIKTGTVNHLQGSYGRAAAQLIRAGYISPVGEILRDIE